MATSLLNIKKVGGKFWVGAPEDYVVIGLDTDHKSAAEHHLWNEDALVPFNEEMVLNIMAIGVKTPIIVEPGEKREPIVANGRTRIINAREANKRLKAMGQPTIDVFSVCEVMTEEEAMMAMASLNVFQKHETPMARAQKAVAMLNRGVPAEKVALAFGVRVETIKNVWAKMANLPADVAKALDEGLIKPTAAVKLAQKPEEERAAILSGQTPQEAPDAAEAEDEAPPVPEDQVQPVAKKKGGKKKAGKKAKKVTAAAVDGKRGKKFYKLFATDFAPYVPEEFMLGVQWAHGMVDDDTLPPKIKTQVQGVRCVAGEIDEDALAPGIRKQLTKMYTQSED